METIYIGSTGKSVTQLQHLLNYLGYETFIDGIFGDQTHQNVLSFQKHVNLSMDGIVGDYTWTYLVKMKNLKDLEIDLGSIKGRERNFSLNHSKPVVSDNLRKRTRDQLSEE